MLLTIRRLAAWTSGVGKESCVAMQSQMFSLLSNQSWWGIQLILQDEEVIFLSKYNRKSQKDQMPLTGYLIFPPVKTVSV